MRVVAGRLVVPAFQEPQGAAAGIGGVEGHPEPDLPVLRVPLEGVPALLDEAFDGRGAPRGLEKELPQRRDRVYPLGAADVEEGARAPDGGPPLRAVGEDPVEAELVALGPPGVVHFLADRDGEEGDGVAPGDQPLELAAGPPVLAPNQLGAAGEAPDQVVLLFLARPGVVLDDDGRGHCGCSSNKLRGG